MSNRRSRTSSFDQPNLFGPPEQPDLFADAPRRDVYVPKQEHVRNALQRLLEQFRETEGWSSWPRSLVELRRDRVAPYLVARIEDKEEAAEWRRLLDAEIARLHAATPPDCESSSPCSPL